MLATDGTGEVIEQLGENIFLNEYRDGREGMGTGTGTGKGRVEAKVMKWGHALSRELLKLKDEDEDEEGNGEREFEVVFAADVVGLSTFLLSSLPCLLTCCFPSLLLDNQTS